MARQRLIGELLVEQGLLTEAQLKEALELQRLRSEDLDVPGDIPLVDLIDRARKTRESTASRLLGEILIEKEFVNEEAINKTLQRQKHQIKRGRPLKHGKLQTLLDLSTVINSTINLIELLTLIMESANEVMDAEASTLMLLDERTGELVFSIPTGPKKKEFTEVRLPAGVGIAGWVATHGEPLLVGDTSKDPRFFKSFDESFDFKSQSILCVPLRVKGKTLGVLEVINKRMGGSFEEEDLYLLNTFGNMASIAIENARLYTEAIERQRLMAQLKVAKDIQDRLLPAHPPELRSLEIEASMRPASVVSGDFYDFIELDDEKLAVLVGDVVGKGIPAAILMAAARSTIRSQFENLFPLSQVMERVNRALFRDTAPGTFLTIFCGLFDPGEKTFTYTNCGHNPALYVSRAGNTVRELDVGGTVVGAFHDLAYKEACIQLCKGDLLILYTDGITEALGPSGETFGRDRLIRWAENQGQNSGEKVIPSLLETLQAFTHQLPRRDDQTVVVLKLK